VYERVNHEEHLVDAVGRFKGAKVEEFALPEMG